MLLRTGARILDVQHTVSSMQRFERAGNLHNTMPTGGRTHLYDRTERRTRMSKRTRARETRRKLNRTHDHTTSKRRAHAALPPSPRPPACVATRHARARNVAVHMSAHHCTRRHSTNYGMRCTMPAKRKQHATRAPNDSMRHGNMRHAQPSRCPINRKRQHATHAGDTRTAARAQAQQQRALKTENATLPYPPKEKRKKAKFNCNACSWAHLARSKAGKAAADHARKTRRRQYAQAIALQ